ncbi:MAG: hypothetical protein AB7P04_12010 [Bacteriovoracia bacterium]
MSLKGGWTWLGAFVVFGVVGAASAADQTNREIVRTFANFYFQQGEYAQGQNYLMQYLETDAGDVGAWNLLGIFFAETNEFKKAQQAFYHAAKNSTGEDRGIYLYHYADALARNGDMNEAKKSLELARAYPTVTVAADAALDTLTAGKPLPDLELDKPGKWSVLGTLGTGYDTNVLLSSDTSLASTTTTNAASLFSSLTAQALYTKEVWGGRGNARTSAGYTYYFSSDARTYNSLGVVLAADWGRPLKTLTGWTFSYGNEFSLNYLNYNGFRFYNWSDALSATAKLQIDLRSEVEFKLPLRYQKFKFDTGDDAADDRTGFALPVEVTYRRYVDANVLSAGLKYERLLASGANYRSHTFSLPLSWTRLLPWELYWGLGLEGARVTYPESSTGRADTYLRLSTSFTRVFSSELSGTLSYGFQRNISNVASAQYGKHAVSILVTYGFL